MAQNKQNPVSICGKQPTGLLRGDIRVERRLVKNIGFARFVRKNNLLLLLLIVLVVTVSSCKTKEVPGRRRTPRRCNTCTKWSYVPVTESMDELALQSIDILPPSSFGLTGTERLGMTYFQN